MNLDEKRIAEILKYAEIVFLTRRFVEEMIPGCHTEKDGLTFMNGLGDGNGKRGRGEKTRENREENEEAEEKKAEGKERQVR